MDIYRLRVEWSGSGVTGPGLSTFYAITSGALLPSAVNTFFTALKGFIADPVSIRIPNSGDVVDASTGTLTGVWTSTGGGVVEGNGTGTYAQGVGCRVKWRTALIENGRRVNGSTFVVPLKGSSYSSDGTLSDSDRPTLEAAATGLVTDMTGLLAVWHRPGPNGAGVPAVIVDAEVPDKVSWLRSRRT